jgi:hypothetical protein
MGDLMNTAQNLSRGQFQPVMSAEVKFYFYMTRGGYTEKRIMQHFEKLGNNINTSGTLLFYQVSITDKKKTRKAILLPHLYRKLVKLEVCLVI